MRELDISLNEPQRAVLLNSTAVAIKSGLAGRYRRLLYRGMDEDREMSLLTKHQDFASTHAGFAKDSEAIARVDLPFIFGKHSHSELMELYIGKIDVINNLALRDSFRNLGIFSLMSAQRIPETGFTEADVELSKQLVDLQIAAGIDFNLSSFTR